MNALLLAGILFALIAGLAWLERREAKREARHDKAVQRILGH